MPIFGHMLLTITLPSLGQLVTILMGAQETIVYRLVMGNPSYDAYFPLASKPLSQKVGPLSGRFG